MKKLATVILAAALALLLSSCSGIIAAETESESYTSEEALSEVLSAYTQPKLGLAAPVTAENAMGLVRIGGVTPHGAQTLTLDARLENKSSDKAYTFTLEGACINGVQGSPFFSCEVKARGGADAQITLSSDDFGIDSLGLFSDIELRFIIYPTGEWSKEMSQLTVRVFPYGEENAFRFVRSARSSDVNIISNEYLSAAVTSCEKTSWGLRVRLYLVNNAPKELLVCADEASVNGKAADPIFSASIYSGKSLYADMTWSDATLGGETPESVFFKLRAYFPGDSQGFVVDEEVTLSP